MNTAANLKTNKSAGIYLYNIWDVKNYLYFSVQTSNAFNVFITKNKYQTTFKIGLIKSLIKRILMKFKISSYISNFNMSELFEKILKIIRIDHNNNIISRMQCEFRNNVSTEHALYHLITTILKPWKKNRQLCVYF